MIGSIQWRRLCSALSLVLCTSAAPGTLLAQAPRQVEVLAIHTSVPDTKAYSPFEQFVRPALEERLGAPILLHTEYLGLDRFPDAKNHRELINYLNARYGSRKIDVIVCVGSTALEILTRHTTELLPDIPVVFTAVEWRNLDGLSLGPNVTGVAHADDWRGGLEGVLRIHPDTRQVVVVGGAAPSDLDLLEEKKKAFTPLEAKIQFRYLNNLPLIDLLEVVRKLPPQTLVFASAFSFDVTGRILADDGALELIYKASNAPVYNLVGRNLGQGFVGGPVAPYRERLTQAAAIAYRIISGEKPSAIPVQNAVPDHPFAFDSRQLQRWRIDASRLPPGSLVSFEEPSLWARYRWQILVALSVVVLELILIAALLFHRSRLHKASQELRRSERDLRESRDEIRDLAGKLMTAQEDERRLIARELHDDLSQQAAALGIVVSNLKTSIAALSAHSRDELGQLRNGVEKLSDSIRRLSHELHPSLLEYCGLGAALEAHCEEFTRVTGIGVSQQKSVADVSISPDVALCLYRITQEALRNVAKYSGAKEAAVRLVHLDGHVELAITDSGRGFDLMEAKRRGGLGLTSMKERARLVKGVLHIHSAPDKGTNVLVRVPAEKFASAASA